MILHLFNDEKVVNRCIETFEKVFPGGNVFICFVNGSTKLVKQYPNVYFYAGNDSFDSTILDGVSKVIIHFLDSRKIKFVKEYIPENIPCTWMVWGGDLYNAILVNMGLPVYYQPRFLGKTYLKLLLYNILFRLGIYVGDYKLYLDFIKQRITSFASSADYNLMQKYIGEYMNGPQITGFSYYPIDVMLGDLKNSHVNGRLILVGNSGGFTNNHAYAFKFLSRLDISDREVLTPMGYGGTVKYRKYVEKCGKKIWGESYQALMTFIPLDEYNRLMTSAEICIYPSWRQEAYGNIVVALYLGAKVFLSEKSSLVEFFRKKGIVVNILEELTQEDLDLPLSTEVKESNRKIIYGMLNEQSILEAVRRNWGDDEKRSDCSEKHIN